MELTNKRILGIAIVLSVLLIAYKYLLNNKIIQVGNPYKPSDKFIEGYNKLKNDGNEELVQTWQGLDAIPDEDETSLSVSVNSTVAQDLVKTDQEYIKGSWGDLAQWMRLSFNRDDAYDKLHRLIFGWYKGVNIQPTGFNIYLFKFEIDDYLNSSSSDDVDNIEINQFV